MKKIVILLAALLIFAGCKAQEPTQEDVNAVMDMAIEVFTAAALAHKYEQTYPGMEISTDDETRAMNIIMDNIIMEDFYKEFYVKGEPPCSTLSGTINISQNGTTGNLKLKDGIIKTLEFSNADGVRIVANGYEFGGITD